MPTEETADAHADDTVVGDERIIEERSRRTRGNLRSSVSRGLSSLLTRRKSRRASDTAPNDEEDNEDGEEDGAEIAADLPMNEVEDEDADSNCIVCMDAPRDSTVLPCRHTCVIAITCSHRDWLVLSDYLYDGGIVPPWHLSRASLIPSPLTTHTLTPSRAGCFALDAPVRCAIARMCNTAAQYAAQKSNQFLKRMSNSRRQWKKCLGASDDLEIALG